MTQSRIERLCVFCGAHCGARGIYQEQALAFGQLLAQRGITLVYGAGSVGLMGVLADSVLARSGKVIGVIPRRLAKKELMHEDLTERHIVETMHERKALMADLADAFVALPGGFGTFEEILEVITWEQLGIQAKPIGFLNVEGYFDHLISSVEHGIDEGFILPQFRELFVVKGEGQSLIDALEPTATLTRPRAPGAAPRSRVA